MATPRQPRDTWSLRATRDRWHQIWVAALEAQATVNPDLPREYAAQLGDYKRAADEYRDSEAVYSTWRNDHERHLKACRHEVVAALRAFNQHAHADVAHLGLTSCDVTETANQLGIRESMAYVHHRTCQLARLIADQVAAERDTQLVARTHGQPAQLTTLGYRYATLLEPLNQWIERWAWYSYQGYHSRPLAGAVGTWADQSRVLAGWGRDEEASTMASEATGSPSEVKLSLETPEGRLAATEWLLTMGDQMAARLKATAKNPDVVALAANYERIRIENPSEKSESTEPRRRCGHITVGFGSPRRCTLVDTHPVGEGLPGVNGHILGRVFDVKDWQETSGNGDGLTRRVSSWDTSYPGSNRPDVSDLVERFQVYTASNLGYSDVSDTSRQVYHRSADLHWAAMLAELASIAQTWATDRRLESMLGLGQESFGSEQVGSSAMPHKQNPRFSERICALAAVTRSHLAAFAELAGAEWLEGDVSTSAARRKLLANTFENIDALLQNWCWLITHWEPNIAAIEGEVDRYLNQMSTGALIQAAMEAPASLTGAQLAREEAYLCIREAFETMAGWSPANRLDGTQLAFVLAEMALWPLTEKQTREVIDSVVSEPIGDIGPAISQVIEVAYDRHQRALDVQELEEWTGELR